MFEVDVKHDRSRMEKEKEEKEDQLGFFSWMEYLKLLIKSLQSYIFNFKVVETKVVSDFKIYH